MKLSDSMQSIKDLFVFPLRDPNWKNKLLIGAGLSFAASFIPLIPWLFVGGYCARMLRAGAADDESDRLPEWDEWGDLLVDGLRLIGAGILVMLPMFVLMLGGWLVYMAGVIASVGEGDQLSGGQAMVMFASMIIMFFSMSLGGLWGLAAGVVSPPALAHMTVHRKFSALFDFRSWWGVLRANWSGFVLALVIFITLYSLLMIAFQLLYMTVILCFLAPLLLMPGAFYAMVIYYRLQGQAYGEGLRKIAALQTAVELEPPSAAQGEGTAQPVD